MPSFKRGRLPLNIHDNKTGIACALCYSTGLQPRMTLHKPMVINCLLFIVTDRKIQCQDMLWMPGRRVRPFANISSCRISLPGTKRVNLSSILDQSIKPSGSQCEANTISFVTFLRSVQPLKILVRVGTGAPSPSLTQFTFHSSPCMAIATLAMTAVGAAGTITGRRFIFGSVSITLSLSRRLLDTGNAIAAMTWFCYFV